MRCFFFILFFATPILYGSTWHSIEPYPTKWPTHTEFHPLIGGGTDGVMDEVVGFPMAIKGFYGIITDARQAETIKNMFTAEGINKLLEEITHETSDIVGDDEKGSVFWKGNEDNFTRFLEVLFALWNGSKYADTSNYTYLDVGDTYPTSNVLTPRFISYDGNSWFPDVSYSNPSFYSGKFIINSRTSFGEHARIEYEYFQPIYLGFVKDDNQIGLTKVPVPAIYFAGIVKKDNLEKRLDQVGLTIDVALTLTAIGNVAKLRHLTKLKQLGRVMLASVEITSGFADIMIRYTDLCDGNDDFCEAFQEYNTYLQLGLLSSGLIKAKFTRARNNAKDQYIKHRETLVKRYGKTDTKIKELDGHFGLSSSPTQNSLVNKSDDLVRKSGGVAKAESKLIYRSDFIEHLTDVKGFTQKRAITGGHNLDNFNDYLSTNNIQINRISTTNGSVDGISELTYQIKKADGSGEWKSTQFKKTHYDPSKISNVQMTDFGKEAMLEGLQANRTVIQEGSNTIIKGESSNGIKFLGYQNPVTGEILNFHPVLNY